jgi:hypothetical protein
MTYLGQIPGLVSQIQKYPLPAKVHELQLQSLLPSFPDTLENAVHMLS